MLPVVDKPVIQYVVEEAIGSGIENIVLVTNASKRSIEDHFDAPSADLVQNLKMGNKDSFLAMVESISKMAQFVSIRQKGPYGNGSPILSSETVIGRQPFAVLWGDEFVSSPVPRLKQLIDAYQKHPGIIISGVRINNRADLARYGIADITPLKDNVFTITSIVEKPDPSEAPSNLALIGGYIFPPEIFDALKSIPLGKGGELWLTDAINVLLAQGVPVYAVELEDATYHDTGNKLEYMKTCIEFALKNPDMGPDLKEWLKHKI